MRTGVIYVSITLVFYVFLFCSCSPDDTTGPDTSYSIAGCILKNDTGFPGVTVTLTGKDFKKSANTDNSGCFSFDDLPEGDYTVTPSMSGYIFNPPAITITLSEDTTLNDIVATPDVDDPELNHTNCSLSFAVQGYFQDSRDGDFSVVYTEMYQVDGSFTGYTFNGEWDVSEGGINRMGTLSLTLSQDMDEVETFTLHETRTGGIYTLWTEYYDVSGSLIPVADLGAWNLGFATEGDDVCTHITNMKYRYVSQDFEEQLYKFDCSYQYSRIQVMLYPDQLFRIGQVQ